MTKAYPNNLTWEQWELIADLFRDNAKLGGRTRTVSIYAVMNAILACPVSGMHMAGVTGRFSQLVNSLWLFSSMAKRWYMSLQVLDLLYQWVRVAAGREQASNRHAAACLPVSRNSNHDIPSGGLRCR